MKKNTFQICNIHFEKELEKKKHDSVKKAFSLLPIYLQLQFLPIFYGRQIVVSHLPDKEYQEKSAFSKGKTFYTLDQPIFPPSSFVESWGASEEISFWAAEKKLKYDIPPIEIVKEVHSKLFAFSNGPKLAGSEIIHTRQELKKWLETTHFPVVLKAPLATSAQGNKILHSLEDLQKKSIQLFLKILQNFPIVAQPWVNKVLDFSSQWFISKEKEIQLVGVTFFENAVNGIYRKTLVTTYPHPKKYQKFIDEHLDYAKDILRKVSSLGFFGHIGIDAMVYEEKNKTLLLPILEINARKTMSWIALQCQKYYFPKQSISFALHPQKKPKEGILPHFLTMDTGESVGFKHQLEISTIS